MKNDDPTTKIAHLLVMAAAVFQVNYPYKDKSKMGNEFIICAAAAFNQAEKEISRVNDGGLNEAV